MVIEKIYYIENSEKLEKIIELLKKPEFTINCETEVVEMDYVKLTVLCLESQLEGVEAVLAKVI